MKSFKRLALLALAVSFAMAPALAGNPVTVGDFVQEIARAKNVNAVDAQVAADALAAVGVRLPAGVDFNKRLTESDVAQLSRAVGVKVTSSSPDEPFDDDQLERFFLAFGDDLGAGGGDDYETHNGETPGGESGSANGNGPPFNPYTKGKGGSKGKKKGHGGPVSPTEPE